jgi:hypothetical protein
MTINNNNFISYILQRYISIPTSNVKVLIDEHHRPARRLGWYLPEPDLHLKFISVKSEDIYLPPGKLLDVYIQSHALNGYLNVWME